LADAVVPPDGPHDHGCSDEFKAVAGLLVGTAGRDGIVLTSPASST
jgi:hypothetical protein